MPEWLVVGLGNPGPEYELTNHNLGFLTIDRVAAWNNLRVTRPEAASLVGLGQVGGKAVVLAKPQTYVNLSGPSVKQLLVKYEIPPERLLVIYDDLDLPWTAVRIRPNGSAGGHHGMESVIRNVATTEFPRVRLGITPGEKPRDGKEFVLRKFSKAQMQDLDELLDHAGKAVESIIAEGVEMSMTNFNRRARGLTNEEE